MDPLRNGPWPEMFQWPSLDGRGRQLRELLERAEAAFRSSAAQLRSLGKSEQASRIEQFADWARLDLDDPQATRLLFDAVRAWRSASAFEDALSAALDFALVVLQADRGNVQVVDARTGALKIAVQRGFGPDFLEYFAAVTDEASACGRAAKQRAQVVVADVFTDPRFAPHREIASASGFRAVQSTPLVNRAGHVIGMISTHYSRPFSPPDRDLRIVSRYGP